MKNQEHMVEAICSELRLQNDFFNKETVISSLYFGGGTPSVLSPVQFDQIINVVAKHYKLASDLEICVEANPDDLTLNYIKNLKSLSVNRLSIGIQSLDEDILKWMNRSHNAKQAIDSVDKAAKLGFENLSVDLIYGVPGLTIKNWEEQLATVINWPINHLSAYSLTLEQKTPYAHFVNKKSYLPPDEESASTQYSVLNQLIERYSWQQYEVSNYCRDNAYSKHNTAYWKGEPYLGIGPAAHSYNGKSRSWNVRSNAAYIKSLLSGELNAEKEILTPHDHYNEYILTGLRTKWGISIEALRTKFGIDVLSTFKVEIKEWIEKGWMRLDNNHLRLNTEGLLFADGISAALFLDYSSQISS